jgi:hypothetical protein
MLDLFGREVKRGDVIVYGHSKTGGFVKYAESRLGVVNTVVPRKTHKRDSSTWKKLFKDQLANHYIVPSSLPDTIDTFEKIAFYPLFNGDSTINLSPTRKNGKPKRNVILSSSFIIIDKDTLSDEWRVSYDEVCKAFKI